MKQINKLLHVFPQATLRRRCSEATWKIRKLEELPPNLHRFGGGLLSFILFWTLSFEARTATFAQTPGRNPLAVGRSGPMQWSLMVKLREKNTHQEFAHVDWPHPVVFQSLEMTRKISEPCSAWLWVVSQT